MTADARRTHRVFGTPGSERLVVLIGTGIAVSLDPLPAETASRDVCVLAVALDGAAVEDPGTYGGETPSEQAAAWLVDLIRASLVPTPAADGVEQPVTVGIVAYRDAVDVALHATVELGDSVDRLALVAVAPPAQPLDRGDLAELVSRVGAETLILNGRDDDTAGRDAALWYGSHIPAARVEMIAGDARLSLPTVWARTLAHVAPGSVR